MKNIGKLLLVAGSLSLILFLQTTWAAKHSPATKRLVLTIDLVYQQRNENGDFDQYQIQNIVKTTSNDRQWTTIPDKVLQNVDEDLYKEDPLILLSKITNADDNKIALKFVIISTAGTKPIIISAPKMVVRFGQTALITSNDSNEKMRLTVIATTK